MVGQLYYDGKWALETSSGSGTGLTLGPIMNASGFDQLLFTYNLSTQNFSNISQTATILASCIFSGAKSILAQKLYQTFNTVSSVGYQKLGSQNAVYFVETQNTISDITCLFTSNLTGLQVGSSHTVFSLNSSSISSIQTAQMSSDNVCFNVLTSSNTLLNKVGSARGFPYNNSIPAGVNAVVSALSTTTLTTSVLSAYYQTTFLKPSVAYVLQTPAQISSPTFLTDSTLGSLNFLGFNPKSTFLFFADNSLLGTRLAACQVLPSGSLSTPTYLISSYSYQSATGFSIFDKDEKIFLNWYGSNLVYLAEFDTAQTSWVGLYSGPSSLGATALPQVIKNTPYLFFSTPQSASWGYNVNSYQFNLATKSFSVASGGTPQQLNVYPTQTATSGSTIAGTVAYFYTPALINSSQDTTDDDVTLFSGSLGGLTQLVYNVYDGTKNIYSGMQTIPTGSPTTLGTPTIVTSSTVTAAIWPVNLNGSYSIWGAIYNPSTQTFSSAQMIIEGFTSMPQLIKSPSKTGVIFGGSM